MTNKQLIADQAYTYIKNGVKIALAFIPGAPLYSKMIEPGLDLVYRHFQWSGIFTETLSAEQNLQMKAAVEKAFQDVCSTLQFDKVQLLSRAWPSLEASMQDLVVLSKEDLEASVKAILKHPSVRESEFLTERDFDALSCSFISALEKNLDNTKLADLLNRTRITHIYEAINRIVLQSEDQSRLLDDYGHRIGLLEAKLAPVLSVDPAALREQSRILFNKLMKHRGYYYNNEVDKSILPPLQRDCELADGETIALSDYLKRIRQTSIRAIQILGEGGMGKSSSLLALWHELNGVVAEIPLTVPLLEVNLCPKEQLDTFILRYLCENYFFKYSDSESQTQVNHLKYLFSRKTSKAEYVLLLDGFNEVTDTLKFCVARQIIELQSFDNIYLIIASRQQMSNYLGINDIHNVTLQPLQTDTIRAYICSCGQNPAEAEDVWELLRTPMLLTVYCETTKIVSLAKESDLFQYLDFDTNVHKKGELISNYFESLAAKRFLDTSKNEGEPYLALVQELWMYYFVLPEIAWVMVQNQLFQWDKTKSLLDALSNIQISSSEVRGWFRNRCLLNAWMDAQDRISPPNRHDAVPENILKYLESWPTIFVKREHWEFIHQDYRDFCAARFVFHKMDGGGDFSQYIPDEILLFMGDICNGYQK